MNTIAQDYAAELRRIAAAIAPMCGRAHDAAELRLAAKYIEQNADGDALTAETVAEDLEVSATIFLRAMRESKDEIETSDSTSLQLANPVTKKALFDAHIIGSIANAVAYAVRSDRPGSPISEPDFIATAREVYRWAAAYQEELDAREVARGLQ